MRNRSGKNVTMVVRRRFPVALASLLLGLLVLLGLMRIADDGRTPSPTKPETEAAPDPIPSSALPALPLASVGHSGARANASPEKPVPPDVSDVSDPRIRLVERGPTPEHPAATGWVRTAGFDRDTRPEAVSRNLEVTIWRVNGRAMEAVENATGLPSETGEFAIRDLPDGEYVIEFVSDAEGRVVRARRNFRVAGYTADLGDVDLTIHAGIRAKVVDVDGRAIEQADVVVVRPEEDPEQARRIRSDGDGWVTYFDLEPDLVHQVVVLGLPTRLERSVRTPQSSEEVVTVVFETTLRTVPTTVTFHIDGELTPVSAIKGLRSDTGLKKLPGRDGVLTTWLLPGTYRFWTEDREGTLVVDDSDSVRANVPLCARARPEEGER